MPKKKISTTPEGTNAPAQDKAGANHPLRLTLQEELTAARNARDILLAYKEGGEEAMLRKWDELHPPDEEE